MKGRCPDKVIWCVLAPTETTWAGVECDLYFPLTLRDEQNVNHAQYYDPGADCGVATAARQRWHLAIRHFGLFGGPLAAAND